MEGLGQLGLGQLREDRAMEHIARDGWALVRSDTKAPVCRGDAVTSGRGEPATVSGGAPPHKPASTGRVYVVEGTDLANGSHYSREYFPSVFGLEWVRPIRQIGQGV